MADKSMRSSCHCGDITVVVPHIPKDINECQCTICRRYAAAWAYYKLDEVRIEKKPDAKLSQYVWGDRQTAFNFCSHCGVMCFHWPLDEKKADAKTGVNTRNMDPLEIYHVNRLIERAWLFAPLDNKAEAHAQDAAKY